MTIKQKIGKLYKEGWAVKDIAQKVGKHTLVVWGILYQMKLWIPESEQSKLKEF